MQKKTICHEISSNPKENAVVIAEIELYQVLKRCVKNPKLKRGKSHGFRIWYCLKDYEIYLCLIEDTGAKDKEKSTQKHIARNQELIFPLIVLIAFIHLWWN